MPLKKPPGNPDALPPIKTPDDWYKYTPTPRQIPLAAPDVGMFDEPSVCVKVNRAWWSHVSGMIDVLSSPDLWLGDAEEKARAVQEIEYLLALREDCMPTVEEICEAVQCAVKGVAEDYLRGALSTVQDSITLNPDGTITVTPDGSLPDDPTTTTDEEARAGGVNAIRLGMNQIWSSLNTWYTGGVAEAEAAGRLIAIYRFKENALANELAAYYYNARDTAAPYVTSFGLSLEGYLYCKDTSEQTIAEWIFENQATNIQTMSTFINGLTQEQRDTWFNQGKRVLSTAYVGYSCVPVDDDSVSFVDPVLTTPTEILTVAQKINHRILFTCSGKAFNPIGDGSYIDALYNVDSLGVATLAGISGASFDFINNTFVKPTALEVPFEPSGNYRFTREVTTANIPQIRRRSSWASGISGTITYNLKDMGEVLT